MRWFGRRGIGRCARRRAEQPVFREQRCQRNAAQSHRAATEEVAAGERSQWVDFLWGIHIRQLNPPGYQSL